MLETAKPTGRPYQCVDCEQVFVQEGPGPLRTRCKPCRRKYISSLPSQQGKPVPPRHRPYTCAKCGQVDIDTGKGRLRKYCQGCAAGRVFIRICQGCGDAFTTSHREHRNCTKECGSQATLTCHWCGDQFTGTKPRGSGRTGKSYCSQECLGADRRANAEPVPWSSCSTCGTTHIKRAWSKCPTCHPEPVGPHQSVDQHGRVNRLFASGDCPRCGGTFLGFTYSRSHIPRYCSKRCASAHNGRSGGNLNDRGREATRRSGARYEPLQRERVLQRDDYVCWICGDTTDPDAEPSTDHYPSVDHVVPLSKGGDHTYDNVRCACFKCNRLKRDHLVGGPRDEARLQMAGGVWGNTSSRGTDTATHHADFKMYAPGGFD